MSDRATVVYSASFMGDSARVRALTVARADSFVSSLPPRSRKPVRLEEIRGGGATVGRWWIVHDQDRKAVWVDTVSVPLGEKNVLLLQGVDRVTRRPDVVGIVAVPAVLFTAACREREFDEILRDLVLASPEIRAFLDRR